MAGAKCWLDECVEKNSLKMGWEKAWFPAAGQDPEQSGGDNREATEVSRGSCVLAPVR